MKFVCTLHTKSYLQLRTKTKYDCWNEFCMFISYKFLLVITYKNKICRTAKSQFSSLFWKLTRRHLNFVEMVLVPVAVVPPPPLYPKHHLHILLPHRLRKVLRYLRGRHRLQQSCHFRFTEVAGFEAAWGGREEVSREGEVPKKGGDKRGGQKRGELIANSNTTINPQGGEAQDPKGRLLGVEGWLGQTACGGVVG